MEERIERLGQIAEALPYKLILSKPAEKSADCRRIVIEKKDGFYQAAAYTEKQVFHRNLLVGELREYLVEQAGNYLQVNAWDDEKEHILLCSKKGKVTYQTKKQQGAAAKPQRGHDRKKKYLLPEGTVVPPLVDMGVFTTEGKVVKSMYDKFRQINRFLEIVEDGVRDYGGEELHIIDFGCGKSYLTFVLYYYFTEIRKQKVHIVGLDLKADVIAKCNAAAEKYGYDRLHFEVGDIGGYQADFPVDMVVTLHACDTATDYALFHAIRWNAGMIFSVPCCQHELNGQMQTEDYSLLTRYGIIKERFAALATDAIRGNLLEYCGYKTQLLEFVDFAHTPKNILIRAVRRNGAAAERMGMGMGTGGRAIVPRPVQEKYLGEVERMMEEFHLAPTLYRLLADSGRIASR